MSNPSPALIDLTGDDDDEDRLSEVLGFNQEQDVFPDDIPESYVRDHRTPGDIDEATLPPPPPRSRPYIIDVSDDDEYQPEGAGSRPNAEVRRASTSSDIVFVGERIATPPINPTPNNRRPSLRDRPPTPGPHRQRRPRNMAAPPPLPGLGGLPDLIRRSTHALLGGFAPPFLQPNPNAVANNANFDNDDFEIVQFDYGQAAFPMGDRSSETPQATPGEAYKAPPPVPEGFAGDVEEDGIYICPRCDEELATGDTEEKQQVWVVKQCGHVYCGGCARQRVLRNGTKKDKKQSAKDGTLAFKICAVEDCHEKVDTKGAMIQVYL